MNPLALRVVKRALAEGAQFDPVSAFDEMAELHRLAEEMRKPPIRERLDALDAPIAVGNVRLWRVSLAAKEWLQRVGRLFPDDDGVKGTALFFALAHARDLATLRRLDDAPTIRKALREWAAGITASVEELQSAVEAMRGAEGRRIGEAFVLAMIKAAPDQAAAILSQLQERDDAEDSDVLGGVLSFLMSTFPGHPMEYWLVQSEQNIHALIAGHAERQASAVKPAAGKAPPSPWQVEAHKRFHAAAGAFLAKWTGGKVRAP